MHSPGRWDDDARDELYVDQPPILSAMALDAIGLQNLAKSVDLRIDAVNAPTAPGQPHVFQIRPAALLIAGAGGVLIPTLPTDAALNAALPVHMSVKWAVETANGTAVGPREAATYSNDVSGLEATVMVLPDFVELRAGVDLPTKTRYVTATVTLTAPDNRTATEIELVRHPVTVPAIPIPTVALFFATAGLGMTANDELQGGDQFVIIIVPGDSPIGSISALRFAIDQLREISSTAAGLASLANAAQPGLNDLVDLGTSLETVRKAFDAHALIGGRVGAAFIAADSVSNLNNIDAILGPHVWNNDVEAEDTISSLVLIGPPGRRIRCFQHRNFRGWNMAVRASDRCITILRELGNPPVSDPVGNASSAVSGELDNRMSSVAFL